MLVAHPRLSTGQTSVREKRSLTEEQAALFWRDAMTKQCDGCNEEFDDMYIMDDGLCQDCVNYYDDEFDDDEEEEDDA